MRTSELFLDILARVADAGRALSGLTSEVAEAGPEALADLCGELLSGRGEATGMALAREILDRLEAMDAGEKAEAFSAIAARFGVDQEAMQRALAAWQADPSDATARALHFASEPRTQQLFRVLNRAPGGTAALVALRADLLGALRERPELDGVDADFRHLFASWFNRGFLELRRIDWNTPAAILEKIIEYEAVHAIQGWDDLRRRVAAPDRQLYAFFHPALKDDPLIFVEVALTEEIPGAIGPVLAEERAPLAPQKAKVAVFYSISNCQAGLRGVSFGSFLIKQVVEELGHDVPGIRTFVTLSPVPGLRAWALREAPEEDRALVETLEAGGPAEPDALRTLAAHYLVSVAHPRGGARDPVARFHLGNGARLEAVHAGADGSARGRANSWGVMVNYLYDLETIEKNHEAYANEGAIACSTAVRRLLRARQGRNA